MKKVTSAILVCFLLVACVFSLAACKKTLSGSYARTVSIFGMETTTTYNFDGNEVTVTSKAGNTTTELGTYTYEITKNDEGAEIIVFTKANSEGEETKTEYAFTEGSEGGKKYIKIGNDQYFLVD